MAAASPAESFVAAACDVAVTSAVSFDFVALAAFAGRFGAVGLCAAPPAFAGRVFFGEAAFAGDAALSRDLRAGVAGCLAAFAPSDGRFAALVPLEVPFAAPAAFAGRFTAFAGAFRPDFREVALLAPPADLRGDFAGRAAFPATLRADPPRFPAVAFFAVAGRVAVPPAFFAPAFFTADFFAPAFFGRCGEVFFVADFFAPFPAARVPLAAFVVRPAVLPVPLAALRDEPLPLPAAPFRAAPVAPPLFFAADLRTALAVDRLADFFVVAFFTLLFPAAFFVVLLTLRDLPTDFFDPERLADDDRVPAARARPAVVPRAAAFRPAAFFVADFFVAGFFVAGFFVADFFVADFFVADFFVADFFVADFFVADFFVAVLPAGDLLAVLFRPAAFFAALLRAAGGRTVATRGRVPPVSAAVAPIGTYGVPSDCSACPAFDVACEAMLTSPECRHGQTARLVIAV